MRRIVFLDRDGVLNEDSPDFIKSVDEWKPIPGSLEAAAQLSREGFALVVVTNQSGVGRGLLTRATLESIHRVLEDRLEALGGSLSGIYFCPHMPDDGCRCRKPGVELFERAARDLGLRLEDSVFVGDRSSDVEAARRVGAWPVYVRGDAPVPAELSGEAGVGVKIFRDLAEAAAWISAAFDPKGVERVDQ